jgi:hypothetical protein
MHVPAYLANIHSIRSVFDNRRKVPCPQLQSLSFRFKVIELIVDPVHTFKRVIEHAATNERLYSQLRQGRAD